MRRKIGLLAGLERSLTVERARAEVKAAQRQEVKFAPKLMPFLTYAHSTFAREARQGKPSRRKRRRVATTRTAVLNGWPGTRCPASPDDLRNQVQKSEVHPTSPIEAAGDGEGENELPRIKKYNQR